MFQMQHMVCFVRRRVRVVGNHDDRHAVVLVDLLDEVIHVRRGDGVKARDGFVENQQLLRCGKCARQ
jgi:hypothetical protein